MGPAKASNALPFLTAPACQSSGLPGADTGFDPLYLGDFIDLKWLREAELKHGRICMLCALCPRSLLSMRCAVAAWGARRVLGELSV